MSGDVRAEVTGRGEEGEPQKDIIDFRTSEKICSKNLSKIMASENNVCQFCIDL